MNAPIPPKTLFHVLPLSMLEPSKTNPRKRFDEKKLAELAESIKAQGVMQPLLVREITWTVQPISARPTTTWPFPITAAEEERKRKASEPAEPSGRHEIIAGERRYRAAKLAGLEAVPCYVRNLTDLQVLHAQVIENLQRDDLHPLEEAEGYEKLMKEHGSTAEALGAEVGKSRAYIYARLKLCALVPEARQAFYDKLLDASTALLIARIPVEKLQLQALKEITAKQVYSSGKTAEGDTMSYRAARDYIQQNFMTDLGDAPFQTRDADLLKKAGACTDCTKRTGNQPGLFDDVKSKDVCTDTVCFAMKKTAHVLALQQEAEAKGYAVITGKDAKKILSNGQYNTYIPPSSGYAKLDDVCPHDPECRTWEKVLGKKALAPAKGADKPAVQKTLIENTHTGALIETISIEQAIKALREAGMEVKPKQSGFKFKDAAAIEKDQAAKKAKCEQANAYRARLFKTLLQQIEADISGPKAFVAPGLYAILAELAFSEIVEYDDDAEHIARLYMPDTAIEDQDELFEIFKKLIPTLTTQQHFLLLVSTRMVGEINVPGYALDQPPEVMLRIAAEVGIDAAAIEKEVTAEVKAAQKATAAAARKAAATKTSTTEKEGAAA